MLYPPNDDFERAKLTSYCIENTKLQIKLSDK